jgi:hypothetical protein
LVLRASLYGFLFYSFATIGLGGFCEDTTIVWSPTFRRGVMAIFAQVVAILAAAAATWAISRRLTFLYFRPLTGRARELGRYHAANDSGGLGNNGVYVVFVPITTASSIAGSCWGRRILSGSGSKLHGLGERGI